MAFLIDQVLLCSILFTLVAFAGLVIFLTSDYGAVDPPDRSFYVAIAILTAMVPVWLLYHALFWGIAGRTLGLWIMDLRIVRRDGTRMGMGRAIVRVIAYTISAFTLHLATALALFGYERRTVHDVIAGTVVVYDSALRLAAQEPV